MLIRPASSAMNPFLFIVGCARSGTTLLQRLLNAHPELAVVHETHWIPAFWRERTGLTAEGTVTRELLPRLLGHERFRKRFGKAGIGQKELRGLLKTGRPMTYARFVSGLFDLYGRLQGKPLVGDKTPRYVQNMATLHGLWPGARFVHLIRDGRDVCLSALHWKEKAARLASRFSTWGEHAVATAAVWWEWRVRLGREAGESLGPGRYYELRYEALVSQPADECARLCAFLGVPYDEQMLRFHEGRTKADPGLDAKKGWRPITPGLRDWRTQMAAAGLERFEAAAGDLLGELGYPRAVPQPRPEAVQHASEVTELFVQSLRVRNKVLPERL
jgi:hypothetical protein